MLEKRSWKRVPVQCDAEYCLLKAPFKRFQAAIVDITPDGICLSTSDSVEVGDRMEIAFRMPELGDVSWKAEAVWAGFVESEGRFRVGAKITEQDKSQFTKFYEYRLLRLSPKTQ